MTVETAREIAEAQEVLKQEIEADPDLDLEHIMLLCMGDALKEQVPPLRCERLVEMLAAGCMLLERTRGDYR